MTSQKKTPSEYPLFAIRLESDKKVHLNNLVEEVRESLNKKLSESEKLWMKNDVIYQALLLGLPHLKKMGGKKTSKNRGRK